MSEERIARMQQLSQEMYDLVKDLILDDHYQTMLEEENRKLLSGGNEALLLENQKLLAENEELLLENEELKRRLNEALRISDKNDTWHNQPATDKQLGALRYRHIPHDPETITKGEAQELKETYDIKTEQKQAAKEARKARVNA